MPFKGVYLVTVTKTQFISDQYLIFFHILPTLILTLLRSGVAVPRINHSTPSITVGLHPAARAAFEWSTLYPRWIDRTGLTAPLIYELSRQPLFGILTPDTDNKNSKTKKQNFQLFSPLSGAQLWEESQPPLRTLLICYQPGEIDDKAIEKEAWLSVLGYLIHSVDPHKISTIRDELADQMPVSLHKELLGTKTLNDRLLSQLTGMARGTLGQQRKKLIQQKEKAKTSAPRTTDELIEILGQPWSSNG